MSEGKEKKGVKSPLSPAAAGERGDLTPLRLDVFLAREFPEWSRTRLKKIIDEGRVLVGGRVATPDLKIKKGQTIQIDWPKPRLSKPLPSSRPLPPIIFEDDFLLAVDKPAGLVVHPAAGHFDGNTLVEIMAEKLDNTSWPDEARRGLVHRLDRDTSGLILFAKTPEIQNLLSQQFAQRQIKKTYLALVSGIMESKEGTLECRIGRHPRARQRFAVSATGRWAFTKFQVKESFGKKDSPIQASLIELKPLTGRTHQLRVQLAGIKHPILGDHVYGEKKNSTPFIRRQMLHAFQIEFKHPKKDRILNFSAPLPDDFQEALKLIRLSQ